MPRIPEDVIQRVRDAVDIVDVIGDHVTLTKHGRSHLGLCPFHDDHSPSMNVSQDKQIYKCFSCGAGGNVSPHDKAPTQVGLIMVNADAIAAGFTIANIGKPFILNIKSASVNGGTADGEPIRIPVILNGVQIGTGTGGVGFPANDVTVVSFDRNIWTHGASALAHDISSAANDDNPAETTDITTGFEITDIQVLNANHFGDTQARTSKMTAQINVYSFALKPEEHQPSGTCNFSRIDNAQLIFTGSAPTGKIYAVNYNVLRIMSGMGGLAYSN